MYSIATYTGNGSSTQFTIPCPYLAQAHLVVSVAGVVKTLGTDYTINTDTNKVVFGSAPANAAAVRIQRVTPRDGSLVNFTAGAGLPESDLDTASLVSLYIEQEILDDAEILEGRVTGVEDHVDSLIAEITAIKDEAEDARDAAAASATQAGLHEDDALAAAAAAELSALSAESEADDAAASAATATTQAGIATTQAGISTTKASEAAASAVTALNAIAQAYKGGVAGNAVPNTSALAGDTYKITSAGTSQGKTWAVGDSAVYNGTSGSWTQLANWYPAATTSLPGISELATTTETITGTDTARSVTPAGNLAALNAYLAANIRAFASFYRDFTTAPVLNPNTAGPVLTFTRASTAWCFDKTGKLASFSTDVPRFDYDPVTLAPLGLLIEEARTNNLTYSDDLTNAAWAKTNATAAKTAIGLAGTANSCSTLTATAANATALNAITLASGARVFSIYLKRRTGTGTVQITVDGGTNWVTVGVTSTWTRFITGNVAITNPSCGVRLVTSGDEVDVDGAQLEGPGGGVILGYGFPTSYVPTTSAPVTRATDVCYLATSEMLKVAPIYPATVFSEFDARCFRLGQGGQYRFAVANGDTGIVMNGGTSINLWNGSSGFDLPGADFTGTISKAAYGYSATSVTLSGTGNSAVSAGSYTQGDKLVRFNLGDTGSAEAGGAVGSRNLCGTIRRICFFDQRLTDSQILALTR